MAALILTCWFWFLCLRVSGTVDYLTSVNGGCFCCCSSPFYSFNSTLFLLRNFICPPGAALYLRPASSVSNYLCMSPTVDNELSPCPSPAHQPYYFILHTCVLLFFASPLISLDSTSLFILASPLDAKTSLWHENRPKLRSFFRTSLSARGEQRGFNLERVWGKRPGSVPLCRLHVQVYLLEWDLKKSKIKNQCKPRNLRHTVWKVPISALKNKTHGR